MTTTVIALYDDANAADKVKSALAKAGCREADIHILKGKDNADSIEDQLIERGFEEDEAQGYAEAVRKDGIIVLASAPDDAADQAVSIMQQHGSRDFEGFGSQGGGSPRGESQETQRIQEVEEDVSVGKRRVMRGGVRIHTTVQERPVEETVQLREERVDVKRSDAERKLSPEEAEKAFKEGTVEMTETAEEAEVKKEARVVGEVTLGKSTDVREETVRETARRTEVEVEKMKGKGPQRK